MYTRLNSSKRPRSHNEGQDAIKLFSYKNGIGVYLVYRWSIVNGHLKGYLLEILTRGCWYVEQFETDKEFIIFYRNLKEELGMKWRKNWVFPRVFPFVRIYKVQRRVKQKCHLILAPRFYKRRSVYYKQVLDSLNHDTLNNYKIFDKIGEMSNATHHFK